jgi:prolipoprotein diacylglyceryltransferase
MVINKINFPIYDVLIIFSIIVGAIYIYISVGREKIPKKNILFFFLLFFLIVIVCGKIYTLVENPGSNFFKIGVTGYGGLIGTLLSSFIYYLIYKDKRFIKYAVLSLPLMYGFAKLACFFHGCCYGIPYNGFLAVTYPHVMSESLFPVQLVETISFIILFNICNYLSNHKNIIYIALLLTFLLKFLLDFFRYSHIKEFLSNNQIVSIIFCFITIFVYYINKKKASN